MSARTLDAAARAWLRDHRADIPRLLPPPSRTEPTQRGHRGHTIAVMDAALVGDHGEHDPLAWLIARERLKERAARATEYDAMSIREAEIALEATDRRAAGWTSREGATRTLERLRAQARAQREAGQIELFPSVDGEGLA